MDFDDARRVVQQRLDELYADDRESPTVLPYGFDTGASWAPMIDWDGVMGVFTFLVHKRSGALKALSFPEFEDMPGPLRVGQWPVTT